VGDEIEAEFPQPLRFQIIAMTMSGPKLDILEVRLGISIQCCEDIVSTRQARCGDIHTTHHCDLQDGRRRLP
jgi:hypothetical protein